MTTEYKMNQTPELVIKKGSIIEWVKWPHKIIQVFNNRIHVRPCNSSGRVRMHSPTTTLIYANGQLTLSDGL